MRLFGGRKYKYRVLIRGGGSFRIDADDLDLEWDSETGEIKRYNFTNPKGEIPCHLVSGDIVTILQIS